MIPAAFVFRPLLRYNSILIFLKEVKMETKITGKVFVVGDNIDTDQIIPAEYLSYNPADEEERKFFGRYAMSGVPEGQSGLPKGDIRFTTDDAFKSDFAVIVAGKNFGCGSSREHAPL